MVAGGHGNDLAGVDHADLNLLARDHDEAALGDAPLDRDRPGWRSYHTGGPSGSSQSVPVSGRNGARHGAQQFAIVADDRHLRAVHPERDALAGEFVADIQLRAGEAGQAYAVDHPLDLDRRSVAGRQGRRPGRAATVSGETGQLGDTESGGQGLERVPSSRTCRVVSSAPDSDRRPASGGPSQICWPPIHRFPDGGPASSAHMPHGTSRPAR